MMGLPLDPVLARLIMVAPGELIVLKIKDNMCFWKKYIDDILKVMKEESIEYVL